MFPAANRRVTQSMGAEPEFEGVREDHRTIPDRLATEEASASSIPMGSKELPLAALARLLNWWAARPAGAVPRVSIGNVPGIILYPVPGTVRIPWYSNRVPGY